MSPVSISEEVVERARRFVESKLDLDELYTWVMDHMEDWGATADADATFLANGILLASWEHYDGHRDEASVREFIAHDLADLSDKRESRKA